MKTALGIIDAQRGFMPTEEGDRLGLPGFGELPVPNGESVVPALNKLLTADVKIDLVFTTQDWHPAETAHFSDEPNFDTTWPTHCVANTPGAEIHPALEIKKGINGYKKGQEKLVRGEDDTSYSGFNGIIDMTGHPINIVRPEWQLQGNEIEKLVLGGLALDYCVKATALDFATKTDIEVVVLSDAVKPVAEETGRIAVQEMLEAGIRFATVDEIIEELREE